VFDGNIMSPLRRRFWVLEKGGTTRFTIEHNDLKPIPVLLFVDFKKSILFFRSGSGLHQVSN